jgi:hypothetical protein
MSPNNPRAKYGGKKLGSSTFCDVHTRGWSGGRDEKSMANILPSALMKFTQR